jgi:hypothetical protein
MPLLEAYVALTVKNNTELTITSVSYFEDAIMALLTQGMGGREIIKTVSFKIYIKDGKYRDSEL